MPIDVFPDEKECKRCTIGSCCYEGAELSQEEVRRIIRHNPPVAKPWFRLVKKSEGLDHQYPFSTIIRGGTCVFQGKDNRCMVYKVRPQACRDFPLETGKPAQYCRRLCVLFKDEWGPNSAIKRVLRERENI